jgi:hypothetical protein
MASVGNDSLRAVPEVRAALAVGLLFVLTPVGQRLDVSVNLALAVVVAAALAAALPGRLAVLVAGTGWALVTGFLVNGSGVLTFGGRDLVHLGLVVGVTAAVSMLRSQTAYPSTRPTSAFEAEPTVAASGPPDIP